MPASSEMTECQHHNDNRNEATGNKTIALMHTPRVKSASTSEAGTRHEIVPVELLPAGWHSTACQVHTTLVHAMAMLRVDTDMDTIVNDLFHVRSMEQQDGLLTICNDHDIIVNISKQVMAIYYKHASYSGTIST